MQVFYNILVNVGLMLIILFGVMTFRRIRGR